MHGTNGLNCLSITKYYIINESSKSKVKKFKFNSKKFALEIFYTKTQKLIPLNNLQTLILEFFTVTVQNNNIFFYVSPHSLNQSIKL